VGPGPVWTGAENLAPTGIRSPDRPVPEPVAILTELPGPHQPNNFREKRSECCLADLILFKIETPVLSLTQENAADRSSYSTTAKGSRDGLNSARCCDYSYMCS
jgi:hypothetical protein